MTNYERVSGVGYRRFTDDEDEPVTEQNDAKIEEMYFEQTSGDLDIRVQTEDGFITINVPVLHSKKWTEFVNSLPKGNE